MTNQEEQLAGLEALLFVHGEPLTVGKIATLVGLEGDETRALITAFSERLAAADRGLAVVIHNEKVQLVTKPQFSKILEQFVKSELSEDLTPAAIETLAIISYFGPISRARIDYQRGVNSTFMLRSLLLRGLVERAPDPARMNSYVYSPSFEMLKYVGLSKSSDLPNYEKFKGLLAKFETDEAPAASAAESLLQASSGDTSSPDEQTLNPKP